MSILSTYGPEVALRVRIEEHVEDIALEMLREGDSIEKIARITKLPIDVIQALQRQVTPSL